MTLGTPVLGTIVAGTGASATVTYPAVVDATDVIVLIIGQKPATANGGGVTTPAGFTLRESLAGAGGYGTTLGVDTGNTNLYFYTKDTVTGSEDGTNLTVTLADTNVKWAGFVRIPTSGGAISFGASDGADTSAGNVSIACAADPGFAANDMALWALCIPTDVTTPVQFSAHAITAAGATFGAATELGEPDSAAGNDIGGLIAWAMCTAGTSSGAPTFTATAGGTTTNVRGPGIVLRIREVAGVVYVYKGSAGWAARYKGVRSDAALYKGAKTLHP
jgi:hypothetical protein